MTDAREWEFVGAGYFVVALDQADLGSFSSCEGLGLDFQVETREAGGGGDDVHQLHGRVTYNHLTLTRPISSDSKRLYEWLKRQIQRPTPCSGVIHACRADGEVVMSWELNGVVPVRWSGPRFDLESGNEAAVETLELAFEGFL